MSLSQGSCIGCFTTPRQTGHSSSCTADSTCALDIAGCIGAFMIYGGASALMSITKSVGLLIADCSGLAHLAL